MVSIVIYVLIGLIIGSITCLFGKKLYFPVLMLTAFSAVVTISLSVFDLTWKAGAITVIAGVLLALFVRCFYKVGVFLFGGVLGGLFSLFVISSLPSFAVQYSWLLALALVLVFGICAVRWCDFFIIASTAFNGAFTIATLVCFLSVEFRNLQSFIYVDGAVATMSNLNHYLNSQFITQHSVFVFAITAIIAFAGIAFQMSADKKDS